MEKALFNDDLLWDYADGLLEGNDQANVENYLRENSAAQTRLAAILAEKQALRALPNERPPAGFSAHVMAAWVSEQMATGALSPKKGRDWVLLSIVALLGIFLATPFIALIFTGIPATSSPILEDYKIELPRLPLEMVLNNSLLHYAILLILAFFTLRFLDKYLQVRHTLKLKSNIAGR